MICGFAVNYQMSLCCAVLVMGSHRGGLTSYKYGKQRILLGFTMPPQYGSV